MTDIIAVVDTASNEITVQTGTGSTLSDGSLPLLAASTLSNPAVVESISTIGDVDTTIKDDGSVLVYRANTNRWTSTTTLDAQNMEGGEF